MQRIVFLNQMSNCRP